MKLWIDDVRPAPEGWTWCFTVSDAIAYLLSYGRQIEIISLDHDAGSYNDCGGDYIQVLNWLEYQGHINENTYIPLIHIHTANPIGRQNMQRIIKKNGWKEVK